MTDQNWVLQKDWAKQMASSKVWQMAETRDLKMEQRSNTCRNSRGVCRCVSGKLRPVSAPISLLTGALFCVTDDTHECFINMIVGIGRLKDSWSQGPTPSFQMTWTRDLKERRAAQTRLA